jgi:WS/DGAT/MGAT family acyltransferase
MEPIDRAWLAMDRPRNPMIVSAILEFEGVRDLEAFANAIFERLTRHDRFRQRIDDVRQPRAWQFVEALDPGYHIQIVRRSGLRSAADLRNVLGAEIGRALDPAFPLWRVFLYPSTRGKVLALFRAHHAMADGIALMQLMLRMVDGDPTTTSPATDADPVERGPLRGIIDYLGRIDRAWLRARQIEREWLGDPAVRGGRLRPVVDAAAVISRTLMRRGDRPAGLAGALSGHRRLDWSEPLALSPLRASAHALDLTLNDLFLSALAGAIGQYLRSLGSVDPACDVCISVPVNLRASDDRALGNHFGLVLLDLPVGEVDAVGRRVKVGQRMRRLKRSMEAKAILAALAAVGRLPPAAGKLAVDLVASKACAVVSNLPGPDHLLHFGGARLSRAMFLAPQTGDIGLGVSILTYAGCVSLAVCADTGVLPDPALLLRPFVDELKSLIHPTPKGRRHAAVVPLRAIVSGRT